MKDFTAKYGIKINDANPDGSSQDEITAMQQPKGQSRLPLRSMRPHWRTGGRCPTSNVMHDGRLEQIATPDELYDRPATPFAAEFVGIMNRIPAALLELLGASGLAADLTPHRERPGSAMDVLVRPEGLRITASPTGNGIVVGRTFLGQLTRVSVRLSGDVVVQADQQSTEAAGIAPGDPVDVSLAGAPVMVAEER